MKKQNVMMIQKGENGRPLRQIKSFILRQGRLTKGQNEAITLYWKAFGIDFKSQPIDFKQIYGNDNPVVLEIGFGMGASFIEMAKNHPQQNYLGIEVHQPGVGACLKTLHEAGIQNVRVMNHDAVEVLSSMIPDRSLARVQIFFPDPWHKSKHHKRRLIQPAFIAQLASKLQLNGVIHLATDWEDYAEQMLLVMQNAPDFENGALHGDFIERPEYRPKTKFEQRGLKLGHGVWDLEFKKIKNELE